MEMEESMKRSFRIEAKNKETKVVIECSVETPSGELQGFEIEILRNAIRSKIFFDLTENLPYAGFEVHNIKLK